MVAEGGLDAVVDAMRTHKEDSEVQWKGCGSLSNLAGNDDNKVKIAAAGGIEAVHTAMQTHTGEGPVVCH